MLEDGSQTNKQDKTMKKVNKSEPDLKQATIKR